MYTCGDMKENLSGDDVKHLRDLDIKWLIYVHIEVIDNNGKNWLENWGETRKKKLARIAMRSLCEERGKQ